ncbi:MAG: toll/interleukin-1 receptor domain-containing protein [Hyphomicrobiaceae bacterium]
MFIDRVCRPWGDMRGKIFVNYRRDDVPGDARGLRDGLAAKFGKAQVFMDVDNLLVGQRFDMKLAEALDACDVLIAIIGPRWTDLLKARMQGGERDYVRGEITAALKRGIIVIPVRVGREGTMPAMPRREDLPQDICDLALYQKHDVSHERFGRDVGELIAAIQEARRMNRPQTFAARSMWSWVGATAMAMALVGWVGVNKIGQPLINTSASSSKFPKPVTDPAILAQLEYDIDFSASEETINAALSKLRPEQQAAVRQLRQAAQASRPAWLVKKGTNFFDLPEDLQACLSQQGAKKPWELNWASCNAIFEQ